MNAERLLQHYETIADAPDAIARLRRFVLDLAVRGKLVPQDANDEPASELLKRKRIAFLPDGPFETPRSWCWVRIGAVSEARLGKMLDKAKNKGTPRPYLRNINVRWFDFDLSDVLLMPFEDSELEEFSLRLGDVLICEGGEPGRAAVWDERTQDIFFQKAIHRVRFAAFVDSNFFVKSLKASADDGRLAESFTGTGIKHFTGRGLDGYAFPLPPLAEQHRIVAKVDELMGLCDRLEAARTGREAVPALTTRPDQIKRLRQTILNLAVRGKLVPQDPNDEPASELLKRIAKEKARLVKAGEIRRDEPPVEINQDDFPLVPPNGWMLTRLATISRRIHYGYTASADAALKDVRMLRITDIQDNIVDWKTVPGCAIDPHAFEQYKLAKGDILIARTGGTIGKTFLVGEVPVTAVFASYLIRVKGTSEVYDQFLKMFLESPLYWTQLYDGARGTGQPNVNGQTLGKLILPLPPLAEQHRIVAKVDALMALCDRLEASLDATAATRHRLLDALLAEALTPVDARELEAAE